MGLGTITDNLISVFSPSWALRRAQSRRMLAAYAGADTSRNNRDWSKNQYSADGALLPVAQVMNARARGAVRDHWAASSIVQGARRHIVGTGIRCRSDARDLEGNKLADFNSYTDWAFNYWASRPELCDIEKKKTLWEMQSLCSTEFKTVGQAIIVMTFVKGVFNPLRFQMIETEMLDTTKTKNPDTGFEIRGGCEIDDFGAAVAWHIHTKGHPLDSVRSASERIPAERVLHFMRQGRVRQTHGCTDFAPVLEKMQHLKMYDNYTLIKAKGESAYGMVIEQDSTSGGALGLPSAAPITTDANGNYEITIEPGMSPTLLPGQKAKFLTPTAPGDLYQPFTHQQSYEIAAGAGSDFPTMLRNFTQGSFSAQRQSMLESNLETDPIQQLLIDQVMRPLREQFIEYEILANNVDAPDFNKSLRDRDRYMKCSWIPPAKQWIDPANQAAAAKIEMDYRLRPRSDIMLETHGLFFEDVINELDDERNYATDLDIDFPEVVGAPVRNSNEPLPGNASPAPAKPSEPAKP